MKLVTIITLIHEADFPIPDGAEVVEGAYLDHKLAMERVVELQKQMKDLRLKYIHWDQIPLRG